ncbi:uncharacterized protein LOC142767097 [Rhipicephalus microplus]|uniref:uncharacterized protein LOC142767097 n=1 Tax=Rhipicephalus microplus TaxID=6941 RepID=UPI003F6C9260
MTLACFRKQYRSLLFQEGPKNSARRVERKHRERPRIDFSRSRSINGRLSLLVAQARVVDRRIHHCTSGRTAGQEAQLLGQHVMLAALLGGEESDAWFVLSGLARMALETTTQVRHNGRPVRLCSCLSICTSMMPKVRGFRRAKL